MLDLVVAEAKCCVDLIVYGSRRTGRRELERIMSVAQR
jgi:hypothetical protein